MTAASPGSLPPGGTAIDRILAALTGQPATAAGLVAVTGTRGLPPEQALASRRNTLAMLARQGLVRRRDGGMWELTPAGRRRADARTGQGERLAARLLAGEPLVTVARDAGLAPQTVLARAGMTREQARAARRANRGTWPPQPPSEVLAGSNLDRQHAGAEANAKTAAALLAAWPAAWPAEWKRVASARAADPSASWTQIAAGLGLTKHQAAGHWRRLLAAAARK